MAAHFRDKRYFFLAGFLLREPRLKVESKPTAKNAAATHPVVFTPSVKPFSAAILKSVAMFSGLP
jgi:hypothetical protein